MQNTEQYRFYVIKFLELPHCDVDKYVVVPHSWVTFGGPSTEVSVAYPVEDASITEQRVVKEEGLQCHYWELYKAVVYEYLTQFGTDVYEKAKQVATCLNKSKTIQGPSMLNTEGVFIKPHSPSPYLLHTSTSHEGVDQSNKLLGLPLIKEKHEVRPTVNETVNNIPKNQIFNMQKFFINQKIDKPQKIGDKSRISLRKDNKKIRSKLNHTGNYIAKKQILSTQTKSPIKQNNNDRQVTADKSRKQSLSHSRRDNYNKRLRIAEIPNSIPKKGIYTPNAPSTKQNTKPQRNADQLRQRSKSYDKVSMKNQAVVISKDRRSTLSSMPILEETCVSEKHCSLNHQLTQPQAIEYPKSRSPLLSGQKIYKNHPTIFQKTKSIFTSPNKMSKRQDDIDKQTSLVNKYRMNKQQHKRQTNTEAHIVMNYERPVKSTNIKKPIINKQKIFTSATDTRQSIVSNKLNIATQQPKRSDHFKEIGSNKEHGFGMTKYEQELSDSYACQICATTKTNTHNTECDKNLPSTTVNSVTTQDRLHSSLDNSLDKVSVINSTKNNLRKTVNDSITTELRDEKEIYTNEQSASSINSTSVKNDESMGKNPTITQQNFNYKDIANQIFSEEFGATFNFDDLPENHAIFKSINNVLIEYFDTREMVLKTVDIYEKFNKDASSSIDAVANNKIQKNKHIRKESVNMFPSINSMLDSKWTLKYCGPAAGLVELMPGTGIFVGEEQLEICKISSDNCILLARSLLAEIFSENALKLCSITQEYNPDARFCLYAFATLVLLTFVTLYGSKMKWYTFDDETILRDLQNYIEKFRD